MPLGDARWFHSPGDMGTWGRTSSSAALGDMMPWGQHGGSTAPGDTISWGTAGWPSSPWGHNALGTQCPGDSRAPALPATHHEVDVGVLVSEILHQLLKAVLLSADLGWEQGPEGQEGHGQGGHPGGQRGRRHPLVTLSQPCWVLPSAWSSWDVAMGTGAGMGTSSPMAGASPSK